MTEAEGERVGVKCTRSIYIEAIFYRLNDLCGTMVRRIIYA